MNKSKKLFCISCQDISQYRNAVMGIAALSIFIMHCTGRGYLHILNPIDSMLMKIGSSGVDIFLFLSGFGIYCSLDKNAASTGGSKYPGRWLLSRVLKVYVPYFLIMIVFVWLIPRESFLQLLAKLATVDFWMHGNNDGTWFVSFILLLYILSPLLYKTISRYEYPRAKIVMLVEIAAIYAVLFLFEHFFPDYSALVSIAVFRFPQFLIGLWLGYLLKNHKDVNILYLIVAIGFAVLDLILKAPSGTCLSQMLETGFSFAAMWCYIVLLKILDHSNISVSNRYVRSFTTTFCSITLEFYLIHLLTLDELRRLSVPCIVNLSAIILFVFTYFASVLVKKGGAAILKKIRF